MEKKKGKRRLEGVEMGDKYELGDELGWDEKGLGK